MQKYLEMLRNGARKKVILDTDCFNEVDDQFALAYLMRSQDKVEILSVNAAPFVQKWVSGPAEGMEKSYQEILHIKELVDATADFPVYRGAEAFMTSEKAPVPSPAAENIVKTVMEANEPVWLVAIGAITNVASAILMCPEIRERAVVVWLGGHAQHWPDTREYNLAGDVAAAQVVFDSKIPLIHIPCNGVCTEFITTVPELNYYLEGKNPLCDYLVDIVRNYTSKPYGWSKVIWDVTAVAALVLPGALDFDIRPTPIITDDCHYMADGARHPYIYVRHIRRDPLYADLFRKLSSL